MLDENKMPDAGYQIPDGLDARCWMKDEIPDTGCGIPDEKNWILDT